MKLKVFTVYDSKACFFDQPFFALTEAAAIRRFSDSINDDSNSKFGWSAHPEDYSLFAVGDFDNLTGEMVVELPRSLVTGSALRASFIKPNKVDVGIDDLIENNKRPA